MSQTIYLAKTEPISDRPAPSSEVVVSIDSGPIHQQSSEASVRTSLLRTDERTDASRPQSQPPTKKTMLEGDGREKTSKQMSWSSSSTVISPAGMNVRQNADKSVTLTLGFSLDEAETTTTTTKEFGCRDGETFSVTKIVQSTKTSAPVWQPSSVPFVSKVASVDFDIDDHVEQTTAPLLPKLLSRILSEEAGSDSDPSTPTSPTSRTSKYTVCYPYQPFGRRINFDVTFHRMRGDALAE